MHRYSIVFLFLVAISVEIRAQVLVDLSQGTLGSSVVSQDFESSLNNFDCMAADDFVVPTGDYWHIDSLEVYGEYAVPSGTPVPGAGMIVHIYADAGGMPGALVFSDTLLTNADPDSDGSLMARFANPIALNPGHYWLGVSARKDAGSSQTQWQWFNSSDTLGDTANWQNPGQGFFLANAACSTWNTISLCLGNNGPSMAMKLWGCPVEKPTLTGMPNDTTTCSNQPLEILINTNSGGAIFTWNIANTGPAYQVVASGTYKVTVTDPVSGCSASDSVVVEANEPPAVSVVSDSICIGGTKTYHANPCDSCFFIWGDGSLDSSITVSDEGWIKLSMFDQGTGCSSVDSGYLSVVEVDPIMFDPNSGLEFCEGDTIVVSVLGAYASYAWSGGSTVDSQLITQGGWQTLAVTIPLGCERIDSIWVSENPLPSPTITKTFEAGDIFLSVQTFYETIAWNTGSSSDTIFGNTGGVFTVTVSDSNGCVNTAEIEFAAGLTEAQTRFDVFPSPTKDNLNILWPEGVVGQTYQIINAKGQIMVERRIDDHSTQLNLSTWTPGVYWLIGASNLPATSFVVSE